MGVRLIERTTRALSLTDEGQRLYDQVRPHLTGVSEAVALASGARHAVRGKLRVNIDAFFARVFLASRLTEFLDRFPELSVELITQASVGDLVADRFDLAVRFVDPPAASALVARRLTDTPILTVASPSYIARHGRPKHPKDVAQHKRILFPNPLTSRPFEWEFRRGRELVEIRSTVTCWYPMPARCSMHAWRGLGLPRYSSWGRRNWSAPKRLVNLFPDWSGERWPLYALYPSRRFQPAKLKAFVDFCAANISSPERVR